MTDDGADEGEVIAGRYRLVSRVGRGSMGVVWRAHDELLDRVVAVKQLRIDPAADASDAEETTQRAMREARVAARLRHPHAVKVYDVVAHHGKPCLVMEFLAAKSLTALATAQGPMPPEVAAKVGAQVASTRRVRRALPPHECLAGRVPGAGDRAQPRPGPAERVGAQLGAAGGAPDRAGVGRDARAAQRRGHYYQRPLQRCSRAEWHHDLRVEREFPGEQPPRQPVLTCAED